MAPVTRIFIHQNGLVSVYTWDEHGKALCREVKSKDGMVVVSVDDDRSVVVEQTIEKKA